MRGNTPDCAHAPYPQDREEIYWNLPFALSSPLRMRPWPKSAQPVEIQGRVPGGLVTDDPKLWSSYRVAAGGRSIQHHAGMT